MSPLRPIGHIAATLSVMAMTISHRIKHGPTGAMYLLWRTDDGCLYLQHSTHPAARAIERTAEHQVVNRYRKQLGFGWLEIMEDLERARLEFATQAIAEAIEAAA